MARTRRLIKEYTDWLKDPLPGVYLKPNPSDLNTWNGAFEGPSGTPYEGGVYLLEIIFPQDYPFKMFKITIKTKIHHINVDKNGKSWLIDPDQWSPALTAKRSLVTLMDLIATPDVDLAMSQEIYDEWADNRTAFDEKARMMRDTYASGDIRDWHHLHQDPDWARNYAAPVVTQPTTTTSAPISQPLPTFTFGVTSATTAASTAPIISAPSIDEDAQRKSLAFKQRLRHEYEDLVAHPIPCVVAAPDPDNPLRWTGAIDELYGTIYEDQLIKFEMVFDGPPTFKVISPISHPSTVPNVSYSVNLLVNGSYTPTTTVSDLLRGLVTFIASSKIYDI